VKDAYGVLVLMFAFKEGVDDDGRPYAGRRETAFLPFNPQGIVLLHLFQIAFKRRLMFGIGRRMASGSYGPTFNIHLKTSLHGGVARHGFPDEGYFERAMEELKTNGIGPTDLPPEWDFIQALPEFQKWTSDRSGSNRRDQPPDPSSLSLWQLIDML